MANYLITAPNGKKYRVTGQGTKDEALAHLQSQLGGGAPSPPNAELSAMTPDVNLADARADGDRREFDNLPMWQKPLVAADDMMTIGGNAATLGAIPWVAAHARSWANGTPYEQERSKINNNIQRSRNRAGSAGVGADLVGGVAGPLSLAKKGFTATRALGQGLGLVADGAAIGGATSYFDDKSALDGALLGGALGAGGQALAKGLGKIVSPFLADASRVKQAKILAREGVDLTAGQKTGSKALGYLESEAGGGALQDFAQKQGDQFTGAAMKRLGMAENNAGPEIIDKAHRVIGGEFDSLASRNAMVPDHQIAADITKTAVDYASVVAPSMRSPIIEKTANEVIDLLKSQGRMDGKVYKVLRSKLTTVSRNTRDPELKQALGGMVDALDGGMERSIAKFNPNDAGAWRDVRNKYRNLLVVEDAATRAGSETAMGRLSPAALRGATLNKHSRRNYAKGNGDFAALTRAGEAVMKPLPNSGTAARLAARGLGGTLGAVAGGQEGGGVQGSILGGVAGIAAPQLISRAMLSKVGRGYLGNQALNKIPKKLRNEVVRALTYGGSSGLFGSYQNSP